MAASAEAEGPGRLVELRAEISPRSPFRLPQMRGADGMLRLRGNVLERLLHDRDRPVRVTVSHPHPRLVVLRARAADAQTAEYGLARMRFALGVDDDIGEFLEEFARDSVIGASVRRRPWLRVSRRPEPFEALAWAICEQLIEYERAAAIQRRILARLGRSWSETDAAGSYELRDLPSTASLAGVAPALLESLDLAAARALSLRRAAREVAGGRIDLHDPDHERGWRRLRAIPGIGAWTVEMLALHGQGREDQVPAGDLGLLKRVGRALGGGDPRARASEAQVRAFFAPYGRWAGLAASHLLSL